MIKHNQPLLHIAHDSALRIIMPAGCCAPCDICWFAHVLWHACKPKPSHFPRQIFVPPPLTRKPNLQPPSKPAPACQALADLAAQPFHRNSTPPQATARARYWSAAVQRGLNIRSFQIFSPKTCFATAKTYSKKNRRMIFNFTMHIPTVGRAKLAQPLQVPAGCPCARAIHVVIHASHAKAPQGLEVTQVMHSADEVFHLEVPKANFSA